MKALRLLVIITSITALSVGVAKGGKPNGNHGGGHGGNHKPKPHGNHGGNHGGNHKPKPHGNHGGGHGGNHKPKPHGNHGGNHGGNHHNGGHHNGHSYNSHYTVSHPYYYSGSYYSSPWWHTSYPSNGGGYYNGGSDSIAVTCSPETVQKNTFAVEAVLVGLAQNELQRDAIFTQRTSDFVGLSGQQKIEEGFRMIGIKNPKDGKEVLAVIYAREPSATSISKVSENLNISAAQARLVITAVTGALKVK